MQFLLYNNKDHVEHVGHLQLLVLSKDKQLLQPDNQQLLYLINRYWTVSQVREIQDILAMDAMVEVATMFLITLKQIISMKLPIILTIDLREHVDNGVQCLSHQKTLIVEAQDLKLSAKLSLQEPFMKLILIVLLNEVFYMDQL